MPSCKTSPSGPGTLDRMSLEPEDQRPSPARVAIWVVVGGIGAYFLISGILGIISGG